MNSFLLKKIKLRLLNNLRSYFYLVIFISILFGLFYVIIFAGTSFKTYIVKEAGDGITSQQLMILDSTQVDLNTGVPITEIAITEEVQQTVNEIDGVEATYIANYRATTQSLWFDPQNPKSTTIYQSYTLDEVRNKIGGVSIPTIDDGVVFVSSSFMYPAEVANYYNPYNLNVIEGTYPTEYNEILIPDILAELECPDPDDCIGEVINLGTQTYIYDERGYPSNETMNTVDEYVVKGIYETNYHHNYEKSYNVYTSYQPINHQSFETSSVQTEETLNNFISLSGENIEYLDPSVYESPEAYSNKQGYHALFIVVEEGMEETVYQEINQLYPWFALYDSESYKEVYSNDIALVNKIIFILIVISSILTLFLLSILKKIFYKNVHNEIKTDFVFGIRKDIIIKTELAINLMIVIFAIIFFVIIAKIVSYIFMFSILSLHSLIIAIFVFVCIMIFEFIITIKNIKLLSKVFNNKRITD